MKKTILTLVMVLTMALTITAGPAIKAKPSSKANIEFKGDSIVVTDGEESVTLAGLPELQKVRDKINRALDDTLTAGSGTTVEIGDQKGELAPEDIKEISNQWASVAKQWAISGSFCLLGLVALVLFFRFMNRHLCAAACGDRTSRDECLSCRPTTRQGARGYPYQRADRRQPHRDDRHGQLARLDACRQVDWLGNRVDTVQRSDR